jgi:hypothetical protein
MGMQRITLILLSIVVLAAGCRRNPEDDPVSEPAPPPAAALAGRGQSLDVSLQLLEKELSAALGSGLDETGEIHVLTAEAITDRLLEAELPFKWLTSTRYSVESHVRQIQALADRVVAELRSGTDQATLMRDATDLRRKVISLRAALTKGGGNPPASLDSLLARYANDSTVVHDTGE